MRRAGQEGETVRRKVAGWRGADGRNQSMGGWVHVRQDVLGLLHKIIRQAHPDFAYHAVTVLRNYASARHTDANNTPVSCAIGLCDYSGGNLAGEGWSVCIRHRAC